MDLTGRVVADYRIIALRGTGATSEIWEAEHVLLGQRFALKLLRQLPESDLELQSFFNEARRAMPLQHSGIARVFNASLADDDHPFIVYELVDGKTVIERLEDGALAIDVAVQIATEAAEALEYAHSQDVLHRDISSNNIMITSDGHAKIVDFGLARKDDPDRTRTMVLRGTPGFLAPELWQGASNSRSTDIFGLGAVLYHMVTGVVPKLPEPALASTLRASVPVQLERCLRRALAANPSERYASAHSFAVDLRSIPRGPHPNPRRSSILLPLVSALILGVTTLTDTPPQQTLLSSIAVLMPVDLSDDPDASQLLATNLGLAVASSLERLPGVRVVPWRTTSAHSSLETALADSLGAEGYLHGTFRLVGDRILMSDTLSSAVDRRVMWAATYEAPYEDYLALLRRLTIDVAGRIKRHVSADDQAVIETSLGHKFASYLLYLRGIAAFHIEVEDSTSMSLELFNRARSTDSTLAEAHIGIGLVHTRRYFRGWDSGGEPALVQAERSFRRALELDPRSGEARAGLIRTLWEKGNTQACIEILNGIPPGNADSYTEVMVRGEGCVLAGLADRAVPYLEHAMTLDRNSEWTQWMLVIGYAFAERERDAVLVGHRFLSRFEPDREVHLWLALSSYALGELSDAEEHCWQQIAPSPETMGDNDGRPNIIAGCVLEALGKKEEARQVWTDGLRIVEERLMVQSDNLRMHALRASLCALLGLDERLRAEEALLFRDLDRSGYGEGMMFFALALAKRGATERAAAIIRRGAGARVASPYAFLFRHPAFEPEVTRFDRTGELKAALDEMRSVKNQFSLAF